MANESDTPRPIPPPQPGVGGLAAQQPQYTQVNILFPTTQVELPPAEKFKEFPPEAQKAILDAFKTEQMQRHAWLRTQQNSDHQLNMKTAGDYYRWRMAGLVCATILALGIFAVGAILVLFGAPAIGVATLVTAVAGLVGTAVYGHRVIAKSSGAAPQS